MGDEWGTSTGRTVREPVDSDYQSDYLIGMETTLTTFQRNFSDARKAADRGELVAIRGDDESEYLFCKRPAAPFRPFADLEAHFGVVALETKNEPLRDRIRRRLRKTTAA